MVNKSKRLRWEGRVARTEKRTAYNNSVIKPDRKGSCESHRRRRNDNIKTDPKEIKYQSVDWIQLA
jgi:hypothetical protein